MSLRTAEPDSLTTISQAKPAQQGTGAVQLETTLSPDFSLCSEATRDPRRVNSLIVQIRVPTESWLPAPGYPLQDRACYEPPGSGDNAIAL